MRPQQTISAALSVLALMVVSARGGAEALSAPSVSVVFDDSARDLPQDDIRAAVAKELEYQARGAGEQSGVLEVSVEGTHILVHFRGVQGSTDRVLPLPEDRSQVPLMLSLLAGNLARDQRATLDRAAPVAPNPPPPPPPPPSPARDLPKPPPYPRNFFGLHVAQDFVPVSGKHACDPNGGQFSDNFACFYPASSTPYWHATDPNTNDLDGTLSVATTRFLLSFEHALSPLFTVGFRAGLAIRGGPPSGQIPGGTGAASSGTPFFPGHFEARASYWFVPLTNATWHGFVGLGAGVAQVDAKAHAEVVDCRLLLPDDPPPEVPEDEQAYKDCAAGRTQNLTPNTKLDAWKKLGQGFGAVHGGAMLALSSDLFATLDLNVLVLFPAVGVAFEPAIGMKWAP